MHHSYYICNNHVLVSTWIQISSVFLFFPLNPFPWWVSSPAVPTCSSLFSLLSFSSQDQSRLYSHHSFDVESIPDAACSGKTLKTWTYTCAGLAAVVTGPETQAWESVLPRQEAWDHKRLWVTWEPRGLLGLLGNNAAQCLGSKGRRCGVAKISARNTCKLVHSSVCLFIYLL